MRRLACQTIWALAFAFLLSSEAGACRGGGFHYGIFFDDVPEIDGAVVAQITITSVITDPAHPAARDYFQAARARVDRVIKGNLDRREITVRVQQTSCGPWLGEGSGMVVGTLSRSTNGDVQLDLLSESLYGREARKNPKVCHLPPAKGRTKIIAYGSYQGHGFSTTSNGWHDAKPGVGRVVVEDGDTPLYLLLQSKAPTLWRFEGAVHRLERVVLAAPSNGGDAEVAGVSRDRVVSVTCLPDFLLFPDSKTNLGQAAFREAVFRSLGRRLDAFDGSDNTYRINVPSFARLPVEQERRP